METGRKNKTPQCPCCSGKTYATCCEPVHQGEKAETALSLMRSRYAAYDLGLADYIVETTHPKVRSQHRKSDIERWSKDNQWIRLEIVSVEHGRMVDDRGVVEFKAHYVDNRGQEQVHHERSIFLKAEETWYYTEATHNPEEVDVAKKVSRNDPCTCGSGKKYKKCCG